MLCGHEPTMDPRVKWTAEFAALNFDVEVLGFNREDLSSPADEQAEGYRIVRLPRSDLPPADYVWYFKDIVPRLLQFEAAILIALMLPVIVFAEILVRGFSRLIRWLNNGLRWRFEPAGIKRLANKLTRLRMQAMAKGHAPDPVARDESPQAIEMRRLRTRGYYIAGLLRMQFAPATKLFWDYIRDMPVKPDVVHCNDLDTLLVGVLAKQRFGCRVVYDAHEYYPYCDPYGRWLDIKFFAIVESSLLAHVDGAVTVNPMLAKLMSDAYGRTRIYSVPNAEPAAAKPPKPYHSPMTTLAAGRLKCLFQGRYSPKRGMDEIIIGWQHVDGSKAALFMRGPNNVYTEEAKLLAKKLGLLNKSVYFLDPVTESLLVAAGAEADIGIVPYLPDILIYQYSCPNKLSQYMHAGLMVVTNDLPYVRSVVEEARAGLVYNSHSPETLGEVINRVAHDRRLLAEFKANSKRYASETFNWQAYCGIFDALYRGQEPFDTTTKTTTPAPSPATAPVVRTRTRSRRVANEARL